MKKPSKYKNIKTIIDGKKFDSKAESRRYMDLKIMLKAGIITKLELQPRFEICPRVKWNGKTICKKSYVADFKYIENGVEIVEDVKGVKTSVYQLKKSLFLTQYPQYKFIETK